MFKLIEVKNLLEPLTKVLNQTSKDEGFSGWEIYDEEIIDKYPNIYEHYYNRDWISPIDSLLTYLNGRFTVYYSNWPERESYLFIDAEDPEILINHIREQVIKGLAEIDNNNDLELDEEIEETERKLKELKSRKKR